MMKKILLFASLIAFGVLNAQNVDDQKIAFNYIQLPSNPIKGPKLYSVIIDDSKGKAANEDSLRVFESKVSLAESQLVSWIEQKRKIDQAYLLEMDTWQKSVNAGTPVAQPVKTPYPDMPKLKEELQEPILFEEISKGIVDGAINLQGFTKGDGGATITITFDGFMNAKIEKKVSGTGATTKYEYYAKYTMPMNVKVEVPGQGIIINENLNATEQSKLIDKFDSEYKFQYWQIDNMANFWKTTQQNELNQMLVSINNLINDRCGFPVKQYATEIYTIKKFKGADYSDLIDAYTQAKAGYDLIYKDLSKADAIAKLKKAVAIWEKALTESNINDSKARINDKVTALIYVNVAEAYIWMDDYITADNYIQKCKIINTAAGKYKREAEDLEALMAGLKARKTANQ